jgi:tetratricopeptide (TPR) repeat protein
MSHFEPGMIHSSRKDRLGAARCFHGARAAGLVALDFDAELARVARGVVRADPSAPGQTMVIARLYANHGMLADALRCYAYEVSRGQNGALHEWLSCMLRAGRAGEVAAEVQQLLELGGDQVGAHMLAAAYHRALGDFERALQHQDRSLAMHGEPHPVLLAGKAETLYVAGRWTDSEATARQALDLDPSNTDALAILACLKVREKVWNEALAYAEAALAIDSCQGYALEARAFALQGLGRRAEAAVAFVTFVDLVELMAPAEDGLDYRKKLARQMIEELKEGAQ